MARVVGNILAAEIASHYKTVKLVAILPTNISEQRSNKGGWVVGLIAVLKTHRKTQGRHLALVAVNQWIHHPDLTMKIHHHC